MFRLFFKRSEYEPIRESYRRKYIYLLHGHHLYRKGYAWGRINIDQTEKLVLTTPQRDLLQAHLAKAGLLTDCREEHKIQDENGLALDYTIRGLQGEQVFHQLYRGSERFLDQHFSGLDQSWRYLEALFSNWHSFLTPSAPCTSNLQLHLEISETTSSKDTDKKLSTYTLHGGVLRVCRLRKGRFSEKKEKQYSLTDAELGSLEYVLQEERGHFGKSLPAPVGKHSVLNPLVEAHIQYTLGHREVNFATSDLKNRIIEKIPFLAMEVIENQISKFIN